MSEPAVEVAVLGAGIAGCALAYHLASRRVGPTVLYDPRTPAAGATGRAAGIVTEQLWNDWDVAVTRASKEEYARLSSRWDPSAYRVNGFVRWAHGPEASRALTTAAERLRRWGVAVRALDARALAERIPWGRFEDGAVGIDAPGDAVVTPSAMAGIYAEGARAAGVDVRLGTPMRSLRREDGRWELATGASAVRARRIVIAAGAWSKSILATLGHPLPLAPYRTQAAVLRPAGGPDSFPSVHDVDVDVYARPEANGRLLAGDGTELTEVDPETYRTGADEAFVAHLAETFGHRLPGWADAELVRAWAGVCAATPDRRPFVGPVPEAEGLFVEAGFNGFGVMRAGGVGQRLADLLAAGAHDDHALAALGPVLPARRRAAAGAFSPRPGFTLDDGDDPRF
ncbi:MAG TPA: FAD-binding oxidoreductase [Thermoplasmata archaeon]|nr:FAD-binding oxidoreductase [Thermoplasmata archaeon]